MLESLPADNIATFGAEIDGVISYIWYIVLGWLVLAEVLVVAFLVLYRKKEGVRAAWLPGGSLKANAWVLIPAALVLLFDLAIEAKSTTVWDQVKTNVPAHETLVRITARQFAWTFQYAGADGELDTADDVESTNELQIPRDRTVRFQLESLDVLHSFWVPVMRLKQDAVPGRSIPGWFKVTKNGVYEIACAEICGGAHTAMRGTMRVVDADDFDAWVSMAAEQKALIAGVQP